MCKDLNDARVARRPPGHDRLCLFSRLWFRTFQELHLDEMTILFKGRSTQKEDNP